MTRPFNRRIHTYTVAALTVARRGKRRWRFFIEESEMSSGRVPRVKFTQKMDFIALGIQTGPFAVHLAHFVLKLFHLFQLHTGESFLITPEESGIHPTSELDESGGFQCLGHSNWTICSPSSPFCSEIFLSFPTSYWGAISYCPRGPIMGKWNSPNFRIG